MVVAKEVSVKEVVREMVVVVEKKVWAKDEEEMVKAEEMAKAEGMVKVEEDAVRATEVLMVVVEEDEVGQVEDVAEETEED